MATNSAKGLTSAEPDERLAVRPVRGRLSEIRGGRRRVGDSATQITPPGGACPIRFDADDQRLRSHNLSGAAMAGDLKAQRPITLVDIARGNCERSSLNFAKRKAACDLHGFLRRGR